MGTALLRHEPGDSFLQSKAQARMQRQIEYMLQTWANLYSSILEDIRFASWLHGSLWFLGFCWMSCSIVLLVWINIPYQLYQTPDTCLVPWSACRADDIFSLEPSLFSPSTASAFFQITQYSAPFSFKQVKVIDISWDILFGRGGQTLLAYLSWRVFSKYVTTCMEVEPIGYSSFSIIFLQKEASLVSLFYAIRNFVFNKSIRSIQATMFIISSMLFTVAFPTLASAMAGYSVLTKAYVPDLNGNFIPFSQFSEVMYTIHDGWRVDLSGDYQVVPYLRAALQGNLDPTSGYWRCSTCDYRRHSDVLGYNPSLNVSGCWLQNNVSDYVQTYGFFGLNDTESTFMGHRLPAPALNISSYYRASSSMFGLDNWTDPRTHEEALNSISRMVWTVPRLNQTFDYSYVSENGHCQGQTSYKWGFSYLQLHVFISLLFVWCLGAYIMWLKATMTMRRRGNGEVAGEYKAVLELAAAMRGQFKQLDGELLKLTEQELNDRIRKDLHGGSIGYKSTVDHGQDYFWIDVMNWLEREKWWLAAAFVSSSFFSTIWMLSYTLFLFALFPLCGIVYAMLVGRKAPFRLFIVLCWCALGIAVAVAVARSSHVPFGVEFYPYHG